MLRILIILSVLSNDAVALVTDTGMWTQHWRNDTDRGKTKIPGERAVPVSLYPPQIPYGLVLDGSWTSVI